MAALTLSTSPLNVTGTGTFYFQKQQAQHTSAILQVSGTFTSLSFTVQGSIDGTNAFAAACIDLGTRQIITGATTISATDSTNYAWEVPCELMTTIGISTTGPATGTAVFTFTSGSFVGLPVNATNQAGTSLSGNIAATGTLTITSASASAETVGANGATNPVLKVDASTGSVATGLSIKGAAAASGIALAAISSGAAENLTLDAKGTGTLTAQGTATGVFQAGNATNPALKVTLATSGTGLGVTSAAAASGVAVAAISSGTNEAITVDAKGTGVVNINGTATGQVYLGRGGLNVPVAAVTLTALGTTQNSTPSSAQIIGGLLTQTGTTGAGTVTLPTGTQLSTAMAVKGLTPVVGDSFVVPFASLTGQALTITGATGTTVIGLAAIPSGKNALMVFYNSGANTWNIYMIVSA